VNAGHFPRPLWDQHECQPRDRGVECLGVEIKVASVQDSGFNVLQSHPRDRVFRQRQHPGCDVGCEDRAGRSNTSSRQKRLLAGASGDIEDSMADVDSGQVSIRSISGAKICARATPLRCHQAAASDDPYVPPAGSAMRCSDIMFA
jgi:hypothetical protein